MGIQTGYPCLPTGRMDGQISLWCAHSFLQVYLQNWHTSFIFSVFFFWCVYVCVMVVMGHVCTMMHIWRSEDNFESPSSSTFCEALSLLFYHGTAYSRVAAGPWREGNSTLTSYLAKSAGIANKHHHASLDTSSGNPNWGCQFCLGTLSPTESSPCSIFSFLRNGHTNFQSGYTGLYSY